MGISRTQLLSSIDTKWLLQDVNNEYLTFITVFDRNIRLFECVLDPVRIYCHLTDCSVAGFSVCVYAH